MNLRCGKGVANERAGERGLVHDTLEVHMLTVEFWPCRCSLPESPLEPQHPPPSQAASCTAS